MNGKITTNKRGFTLMELLIVIAILGILGVAFVPTILKAPAKARDAVRVKKVQDMHVAIEAYFAERGQLPPPDADGVCFSDRVAANLGVTEEPKDPNQLGSCGAGEKAKWFVYKVVGNKYVIGAKMENPTSANTVVADVGNLTPDLPLQDHPAAGTYYIAKGPI